MDALIQWDHALFATINSSWTHPFLDWLMPLITDFHQVPVVPVVLLPLVLGLWMWRTRGQSAKIILAMVLAVGAADLISYRGIKKNFPRDRPEAAGLAPQLRVSSASGPSFPSNHSANVAAAAMVIGLAFGRWSWLALVYALAVAYSRVYVGVHFPIDVTAGAALGSLCGWTSWRAFRGWARAPGWRWPRQRAIAQGRT